MPHARHQKRVTFFADFGFITEQAGPHHRERILGAGAIKMESLNAGPSAIYL